MKPQELLLASGLIALVAGAGAALATRAFLAAPERASVPAERAGAVPADAPAEDDGVRRALDDLRVASTALLERVGALESRLAELQTTRTALAADADDAEARREVARETAQALGALELTPDFVASVDAALARIEARDEAEREERRAELRAQRIEERVMRLQEELGLNGRQTSDLRTTLLAQETQRDTLFERMRELEDDPRGMRDGLRTIREETHAALAVFLTPAQMDLYRESEEADWGRRGDFAGARPPGDLGGRRRDGGGR